MSLIRDLALSPRVSRDCSVTTSLPSRPELDQLLDLVKTRPALLRTADRRILDEFEVAVAYTHPVQGVSATAFLIADAVGPLQVRAESAVDYVHPPTLSG